MRNERVGFLAVLAAMVLSATHWGKADVNVKLTFTGEKDDKSSIVISTEGKSPLRYSFKHCQGRSKCAAIGRKERAYTLTEIREKAIELSEKRVAAASGNSKDPLPSELLFDLVDAIERPSVNYVQKTYSYKVKGSVGQFIHVVEKYL